MRDYVKLSDRPFLVVYTIRRSAKGVHTHRKDYMKLTGNMESFEQTTIIDRVKPHHLREATVIIDIMRSEVVTYKFRSPDKKEKADEAAIVEHYVGKYMDVCKQGIDIYLTKKAKESLDTVKEAAEFMKRNVSGIDVTAVADDTPKVSREAARRLRQMETRKARQSTGLTS